MQDVIVKLVNISYFPKKTEKPEWKFKPIIIYSFSQTRPTKQELEPITKKDFHFIANIPLAPLRGLLSYQLPRTTTTHRWANCESPACDKCHKYTPLIDSGTNAPIIPYTYLRCIYLLYHPHGNNNNNSNNSTEGSLRFYIAGTSLEIVTVRYTTMSDPIGAILNNRNLHWQILWRHL